jgi:hypothetical protein
MDRDSVYICVPNAVSNSLPCVQQTNQRDNTTLSEIAACRNRSYKIQLGAIPGRPGIETKEEIVLRVERILKRTR